MTPEKAFELAQKWAVRQFRNAGPQGLDTRTFFRRLPLTFWPAHLLGTGGPRKLLEHMREVGLIFFDVNRRVWVWHAYAEEQ